MAYEVYHLRIFPGEDNRYGVDRSETWQPEPDRKFSTSEEAIEYIYNSTVIHVPEFTNLALGLTGEQRVAFAQAFCFDDTRYLKYRRFFLGKPNMKELKATLRAEGTQVRTV
jgi:hypothetical protein